MSDNKKVYSKVLRTLKKRMKGLPERHVVIWAMMVAGIVLSKKARLSAIAAELPTKAKDKSTFRRLQRFTSNDLVDVQVHFMPFAEQIVDALSVNRLVIAMDGSQVGRGCMTLMVGIVYCNRLLPLTWMVYKGKKGHAPAEYHIQVLEQLFPIIPEQAEVLLLGDGEFDNIEMMEWIDENTSWDFTVRTAKSSQVQCDGKQMRIEVLAEKGKIVWLEETHFTAQQYGPLCAIAWWESKYDDPVYLVSSLSDAREACELYRQRALIETLFSDQKSRGFGIDKSHLEDPEKVNRLLMAACLAYIWMVWLGVEIIISGQAHHIDHNTRRDKSVFRLGLDWMKHSLKHGKQVMVSFILSYIPTQSFGVMY